MSEQDEDKLFKKDKRSIMHYIGVMKEIKAQEDKKKELETRAKKERLEREREEDEKVRLSNKYNGLSERDKKRLYDSWLKYFPLDPKYYSEFLKPLTYKEKTNYLHSRIDSEYFELFEVFGNKYCFNSVFYDDPTSKKHIMYLYRPGPILTTKELKKLTLKKIFQMYIDVAIDNFKLEQNKRTDLYIKHKIEDEKKKIVEYYDRKSSSYESAFVF